MCHCAENRQMIVAALRGEKPVSGVASAVAANVVDDARAAAARLAAASAGRIAAAKARLAR